MAAVKEIKSRITLDGEQAFKQALREAGQAAAVMGSEMRAVAAEYKETGDAQKYYADKSRVLKQQIAQQEESVRALSQAVKDAESKWGANTAKANEYTIKLNSAKATLSKMKAELQAADREAEEFGRDSIKVGRQIENGIGDGAEEAQESVKSLIEQMQQDIGSIKGSAAYSVASQIGSQVVSVVQGVSDFVTSNREYRRQLSYLKTAAQSAGYDWEQIIQLNNEIAAFTGDMDGATEATSNLLKTGLDQEWIQTAITMFEGASVIWQETLKIENLAESFQETVATGEATGAFAELVERLGLDLDGLKAILADAQTLEEKSKAALTYISNNGLTQAAESYLEQNEELYTAQLAQVELEQAWAELAGELEPFVIAVTDAMTYCVEYVAGKIKSLKEKGILQWLVDGALGITDTGNSDLYLPDGSLNPEVAAIWVGAKNNATDADARANIDTKAIKQAKAKEAAEEWADTYIASLSGSLTAADIVSAYWATDEDRGEVARALIEMMKPTETELAEISQLFAQTGVDAATVFGSSFGETMDTVSSNAEISGNNAGVALGNGLNTGLAGAYDTAASWANQINAVLGSIGQGLSYSPVYGAAGSTSGSQSVSGAITVNSILKLDGKTIYKSADTYAGRKASRLG